MFETKLTHVTPYAASKLVNAILDENNIKRIPPQMMYNYTTAKVNAGKNPLIAFTIEKGVEVKDLERWTKKYVEKKLAATVTVEDTETAEA